MAKKYDFSGWATKNDMRCTDGRTIRKNAFKDDDGRVVPLVWMHQHNDPDNVLGHALLQNKEDGVYAYCSLNDGYAAKNVREMLRHGDVHSLSIWANNLTQDDGNVLHGSIKEVSVVLAGANPGAIIDYPVLAHGEESTTEAYISTDDEIVLGSFIAHAEADEAAKSEAMSKQAATPKEEEADEDGDRTVNEVLKTFTPKQREVLEYLIGMALEAKKNGGEVPMNLSHADEDDDGGETVNDVLNTMNEDQRKVTEYLVGLAYSEDDEEDDGEDEEEYDEDEDMSHGDFDDYDYYEGDDYMKRNVFETYGDGAANNEHILTHDQMTTIIEDGKRMGSLKEAVLAHADEYGIDQIDWLFPEYKNMDNPPTFIKRDTTWVDEVMKSVNHSPIARIKSMFADITEDEARARGYIKGDKKVAEVFTLLRRTTDPQTVYKLQTIDRDDQIDITDFDVVAWIKNEMRVMLDEELARAYLVGDGRDPSSREHIKEDHIRSIYRDDDLFVIRRVLRKTANVDPAATLIDTVVKAFDDYEGSDNCTMFTTKAWRSDMLLLKNQLGERIYKTENELASAMMVKKIVPVPVMSSTTTIREEDGHTYRPVAIIVNLGDYNVGADKGGSVNMFEDFDIKFNQNNYLIETRCSAALTKPYSAIVIEEEINNPLTGFAVTPAEDDDEIDDMTVSQLQSNVTVGASRISGMLKNVTGYTAYSTKAEYQSGHYLALHVDTDEATDTITVELTNSPEKKAPTTLGADRNVVLRVTNPQIQKVKIVATNGDETITKSYHITGLKLAD